MNAPRTITSLEEDMKTLGLLEYSSQLKRLSHGKGLNEDHSAPAADPKANKPVVEQPIDEDDQTVYIPSDEDLQRIINLPFAKMTKANIDDLGKLYTEMCEAAEVFADPPADLKKDLTEGYMSLFEAAYDTLAVVFEDAEDDEHGKEIMEDMITFGISKELREAGVYWRVINGKAVKQNKRPPPVRKAAARYKRIWRSRGGRTSELKRMATGERQKMAKKLKGYYKRNPQLRGRNSSKGSKEESKLGGELRSLLSETATEEATMQVEVHDRIQRIYELLGYLSEEKGIDEVLEQASKQLLSLAESKVSDEDFATKIKPHLAIVKRMLEALDAGN